nr:putative retrotransposon Ty1-copia subclass protein [Tanacetum cinerariifolium]
MKDNQVWDLVDIPLKGKTIGSNWLFKKKIDMDGNVQTYKACFVAMGFTQIYEVDDEETFSPVVDIKSIRNLIAISAFYDYEIWQIDVKTAFLNRHLSKEVYMVQPKDADDSKSKTGYIFVLNGGAGDWNSARHSIIATLSKEAKYMDTLEAFKEAAWIRKKIIGLVMFPQMKNL